MNPMGGDSLENMDENTSLSTPEFYLDALVHFIRPLPRKPHPCVLAKVVKRNWESWDHEYNPPDPVLALPIFELMVEVVVKINHFHVNAIVLIDTGCRLPLIFKKGLIPSSLLVRAERPIKICTADNSPLRGGDRGCLMNLEIPIYVGSGSGSADTLQVQNVWAYEANIHGSDMILGYIFLKRFNLIVDCSTDKLRVLPRTWKSSRTSTLTPTPKNSTPTSRIDNERKQGRLENDTPSQHITPTKVDGEAMAVSTPLYDPPGSKTKGRGSPVHTAPSSYLDTQLPSQPILDVKSSCMVSREVVTQRTSSLPSAQPTAGPAVHHPLALI